jgi:hypothetical protein
MGMSVSAMVLAMSCQSNNYSKNISRIPCEISGFRSNIIEKSNLPGYGVVQVAKLLPIYTMSYSVSL